MQSDKDGQVSPKIELIHDGWETRLSMEALGSGVIELDLDLKLSKIEGVGVTRFPTISSVPGSEMAFQVPRVSVTRVQTTVSLKDEENLVIGFPSVKDKNGKEESSPMLVSFRARLIEEITEVESKISK